MEPCTHARVEAAWERLLGLPDESLFTSCTVTRHGLLGDYPGVFVVERLGRVHVTAPDPLLDQIASVCPERSAEELMSARWWDHLLGCTYEVRGPAIHHYTDRPVGSGAPSTQHTPRMATLADVASLREVVTAEVWEESGFDDEPQVVFALETERGVVAASNLSMFDEMPADVGVLSHPDFRGHGYGHATAAAATNLSVELNRLARWVARVDNGPSLALAGRLGFEPWCRQLAVRPRAS